MKIYTKTGDDGHTGLYGGRRVRKDDVRVDACGTLDECNAALGAALCDLEDPDLREAVARLQSDLFVVGGDLATPVELGDVVPRTTVEMAARLEAEIDLFDAELAPLKNFILPGGSRAGALVHLARAIGRRAERRIVTLIHSEAVNPHIRIYMNRLSDYLFMLARVVNQKSGTPEPIWERPA